jgi:hypothetical protein
MSKDIDLLTTISRESGRVCGWGMGKPSIRRIATQVAVSGVKIYEMRAENCDKY